MIDVEKTSGDYYVKFFARVLAESDRDYAANADGTAGTVEISERSTSPTRASCTGADVASFEFIRLRHNGPGAARRRRAAAGPYKVM